MVAGLTQALGEAVGDGLGEAAAGATAVGLTAGSPESNEAPHELTRMASPRASRAVAAVRAGFKEISPSAGAGPSGARVAIRPTGGRAS